MSKAVSRKRSKKTPVVHRKTTGGRSASLTAARRKGNTAHKIFGDASLFGSIPGMDVWALKELGQMRDEW